MHGRYFVGYCGVLVVLVAVMGVAVTANAIEQKKREWPVCRLFLNFLSNVVTTAA